MSGQLYNLYYKHCICSHPLIIVLYTTDPTHTVSPLEAAAAEIVLNKDDCKISVYCVYVRMLNKNTLGVKNCEANQKPQWLYK